MPAHSKVGFSSRERWSSCPGSVRLSQGIPSKSSPYADEGTAAHALQEHCLSKDVDAVDLIGADFPYEDHGDDKSIVITEDMANHIQGVLDAIRAEMALDPDAVLLVEERFHLHQLHADLFGTGDVAIWFPKTRRLQCRDLKYGAGVAVDIENEDGEANQQVEGYALGALLKYPDWKPLDVEIVIDQPRAFHADGITRRTVRPVSYFVDMAADLVDEVRRTEVAAQQYELIGPDLGQVKQDAWQGLFLRQGDHCRWCPAAPLCPLLKGKAQELAKQVFAPTAVYNAVELARTLDWLPILEAWIKNVREFAYSQAEGGIHIPDYKLVEKAARAKWREGVAALLAEKLGMSIAAITEPAPLKSVTEIKKLAPGKNDAERAKFIGEFTVKESSGHTLVHTSDKREAVKLDAASAFATP